MHINLIIGAVFIFTIMLVIRIYRKTQVDASDILLEEINREKIEQEALEKAKAKHAEFQREYLQKAANALNNMQTTLKAENTEIDLSYEQINEPPQLVINLKFAKVNETLKLTWDMREFDVDLLSQSRFFVEPRGDYLLLWPDGVMTVEHNLAHLVTNLSRLIAKRSFKE